MFDIGFSELLLTGFVALLVLGPEKLPGAARTAGIMIGRLKRSFNSIKSEVEREIGADEIRRQLRNDELLQLKQEMKSQIDSAARSVNEPASSTTALNAALDPTPKPDALSQAPSPVEQPPEPSVKSEPDTPFPSQPDSKTRT
jgi:sec-independent protein translocase protein TatB